MKCLESRVSLVKFPAMEELDADKKALSYRGKVAERDIVQVNLPTPTNKHSLPQNNLLQL